ncbi:SixA phosphatase family protein [Sphingomonas glaciei]|uniref:Histidine phosphatase family protein n=1 Tax=Sphingomonas glaciei TaxID=2938948 RepID=A0ABY5MVR6_9SPHN|nr:phosphoglycerate mutase family protein [Sphingomonas glaciei]UUR07549.1 histidine phosphatase family protein [Sphingomonas glaciei]
MTRALLALLLLALAGCATVAPRPVPNIYVMRHLNTLEGVPNAQLTAEGLRNADKVADWLAKDPPTVVLVSDTDRARATAAPTIARFKPAVLTYDPKDTPALVAQVLASTGTVLVVGHSNTVPDIVAGLGGTRPAPLVHADFGDIWHISGPERTTVRSKLP